MKYKVYLKDGLYTVKTPHKDDWWNNTFKSRNFVYDLFREKRIKSFFFYIWSDTQDKYIFVADIWSRRTFAECGFKDLPTDLDINYEKEIWILKNKEVANETIL